VTWYATPEEARQHATRPRIDFDAPLPGRTRGRPSIPNTSDNQWHRAVLAEAARRITGSNKVMKAHCEVVAEFMGDTSYRTSWNEAMKRPMKRYRDWHLLRLMPFTLESTRGENFRQTVLRDVRETRGRRPIYTGIRER